MRLPCCCHTHKDPFFGWNEIDGSMPDRDERRHCHEGHPARAAHEQLRGRRRLLFARARGMFGGARQVPEVSLLGISFYLYHVSHPSGAPSRDDESGPTNASQFRIASASSLAERTARSSASPSWRGSVLYSRAARLPASTLTSYSAPSSGKRAGSVVCARAG